MESDSDSSDKVLADFSLWSDRHKLVHRNWKSNKSEESVSDELSVPSERLFSKASQVLTQQRNRIQGKRVNKILFLQSLDRKYWNV
ncbi:unnamed protein product [Euphydryas editha]|uniref:HAT C-terminal dimerisation domain-containing protein n=1 Tax=Euphydryas editha TaxID=104508 RepID=A0AAU9UB90_EUPED|nr:unnamed protein product [Euphydryas editha]